MNIYELKQKFQEECERIYSINTTNTYMEIVEKFSRFITVEEIDDIKPSHIIQFLNSKRYKNESSYNKALYALRSLFDFYSREADKDFNPARRVRGKKAEKNKLPKYFNQNEAECIWQQAWNNLHQAQGKKEKKKALRDLAVIGILFMAGLRRSELINLDRDHIDLENQIITVYKGKGKKTRTLPIDHVLATILANYMNTLCKNRQKIFPISSKTVYNIVSRICKQAGVKEIHNPHAARHYFATRLKKSLNNDLEALARLLGHECIETVKIYVHADVEANREAIEAISFKNIKSI